MEILSNIIEGVLDIYITFLGFILGLISGLAVWFWKARGIRGVLADEIKQNKDALINWNANNELPVRSNYIWNSMISILPGILSRKDIKAAADFYYWQAYVYKRKPPEESQVNDLKTKADKAIKKLNSFF